MHGCIIRLSCLIIFIISSPSCLYSQNGWYIETSFGVTFNLHYGISSKKFTPQRFPGTKIFAGFTSQFLTENGFLASYGGTLSVYNNSLGNSMSVLVDDIQLDFTSSFSGGYGFHKPVEYRKQLRTIGNSMNYNLTHNRKYYIGLSSVYVWNINGRNQHVGAVTGTYDRFSFTYYNDGGPPMSWLGISDGFDRYWTSGAHIFLHDRHARNTVELSFDQFTGYTPMLYELTTLIGINVGEYILNDKQRSPTNSSYNSTQYNLRVNLGNGFSMNAGMMGSLISNGKKGWKYWGLQDVIHINNKFALHPNYDADKLILGINYNGPIWVK